MHILPFFLICTGRRNKTASKQPSVSCSEQSDCSNETSADNTWINEIFQGTYTTMTRCLTCETVSKVHVSVAEFFCVYVATERKNNVWPSSDLLKKDRPGPKIQNFSIS